MLNGRDFFKYLQIFLHWKYWVGAENQNQHFLLQFRTFMPYIPVLWPPVQCSAACPGYPRIIICPSLSAKQFPVFESRKGPTLFSVNDLLERFHLNKNSKTWKLTDTKKSSRAHIFNNRGLLANDYWVGTGEASQYPTLENQAWSTFQWLPNFSEKNFLIFSNCLNLLRNCSINEPEEKK